MKTIAFYSYKGGVGRSLALVNIANRLAEFGKKVCILDFDLEAPGLDCKYNVRDKIQKGLVDYIYEFAFNNEVKSIKDYGLAVSVQRTDKYVALIPAGNTQTSEYWKKLSRINWWDLFYKEDSQGMEFFLNMKEQIKETITPDYLLIDNRTGITETSSLTLSLLADRVVILAANNKENMEGSKRIINSLTSAQNTKAACDIHFVLTRIPYPQTIDFEKDQIIINQKYEEVRQIALANNKQLVSTNVIHSYRELEEDEAKAFYDGYIESKSEIDNEYFKLYDSLTQNDFTYEEREEFKINKEFNNSLQKLAKYYISRNSSVFFSLSENLLEKYKDDSLRVEKIRELRMLFYHLENFYEKAIEEGRLISQINQQNWLVFDVTYQAYVLLGERKKAYDFLSEFKYEDLPRWSSQMYKLNSEWHYLEATDKNVTKWLNKFDQLIEQFPQQEELYNSKACLLLVLKRYDEALTEVYKALELNNEFNLAYATLAEIKYSQGDKNGFYQNLELSFKYGYKIEYIKYDASYVIYKAVIKEERFQNLLKKYNQIFIAD